MLGKHQSEKAIKKVCSLVDGHFRYLDVKFNYDLDTKCNYDSISLVYNSETFHHKSSDSLKNASK